MEIILKLDDEVIKDTLSKYLQERLIDTIENGFDDILYTIVEKEISESVTKIIKSLQNKITERIK